MSTLRVDSIKRLGAASADSDSISIAGDGNVTIKGDIGHVLQTVLYEHYDRQVVNLNNYYYWGQTSGSYDVSITTKQNNSIIYLNTRIFGEPSNHNCQGRLYVATNNGTWNIMKTTDLTTNGHFMFQPYETNYSSTPHQGTFHTLLDTSSLVAGTKISFRLLVGHSGNMTFNDSVSTANESAPSNITLQELNGANTVINRVGTTNGVL